MKIILSALAFLLVAHPALAEIKIEIQTVELKETKSNGKNWDIKIPLKKTSGLPDIYVEVKQGETSLLKTPVIKNSLIARYTNQSLTVAHTRDLTITVWDKDLKRDDIAGTIKINDQTGDVTLSNDGVSALKLSISGNTKTAQTTDTPKDSPKTAKAKIISAKSRINAPDFELDDTDGELVVLSELQGKVVVIVFWATWCEPCKQEIPFLSDMRKAYKSQGLEVLTISTDNAQTQSRVAHYARKWNTRTMIDTDGEVKALLNPRGFAPYTLVIDREGMIAFNYQGYQAGDEKMIESVVKTLLADKN
jgi:peroxiredoxin